MIKTCWTAYFVASLPAVICFMFVVVGPPRMRLPEPIASMLESVGVNAGPKDEQDIQK